MIVQIWVAGKQAVSIYVTFFLFIERSLQTLQNLMLDYGERQVVINKEFHTCDMYVQRKRKTFPVSQPLKSIDTN